MMLGARTAAWAKSGGGVPTARDYVQDGLVAMWDGEWNAGVDIHDDMQRVVNLASNDDTLSNVNVFDNYFSAGTKQQLISTRIDAGCTVECVILFGNKKGWIFHFGNIASTEVYIDGAVVTGAVGTGDGYKTNYYRPKDLVSNQIYSLSFTGRVVLKNGNILNLDSPYYTSEVEHWRFGNRIETGSKIYTVRLYNKNLLQSEIAANYAIDKARFNLPD